MPVSGKKALFAAAGLMALTAAATGALAGGFQIHEQSAEFQGMSFAGTAAGGSGLSSMFWNPATITQHSGWKEEWNATAILPYARAKDERMASGAPASAGGLSGDSGNIGKLALVPSSYDSYQINDSFWIGLAMNAPYGLSTKNNGNSLGALYGYKSTIRTLNFNPMVGVKLNDMISFGVGLQINYMKGNLSSAKLGALSSKIKGDDWGIGFTAGLTLKPTETTTIGIGYRSRVKHKLKGNFYVAAPALLGPSTNRATVKHTLPDQLTVSIRQDITDQFALLGTVEWTNWSLLKNFDIEPVAGYNPSPDKYNWKDSWMFSIGGEYKYSDALTLRAGYAYEKSPVPDSTRNVRVPDNDRHWLSVGASWVANDWLTLNAGYSHLFVKNGRIDKPADTAPVPVSVRRPGLKANYKNHVDIVSVSATVDPSKFFAALGH